MKTKILLFITFLSLLSFKQGLATENRILDKIYFNENPNWISYYTNVFDESFIRKEIYSLQGDTILNGIQYHKLYCNEIYTGAIREMGRKVYAYDLLYPPFDDEILLYDFNLEKGDVFISNAPEGELSTPLEVIEIGHITLLNGEDRKVIYLNSGVWIEGIGDTIGFLEQTYWHTTNGENSSLVCFKQNRNTLFRNETLCEKYHAINCCETEEKQVNMKS